MDEQALIRFISTTETAAVGPVLHSALAKLAPEQLLLQFIQLFSHVADFSNRLDESIAAAWHYFGDNEVWRPSFHSLQAFKVAQHSCSGWEWDGQGWDWPAGQLVHSGLLVHAGYLA